ncbi:hypothetical protein bcgnr5390_63150 [Bacillus luti]
MKLKLTGYPDIDSLLKSTYELLEQGKTLHKQIEQSVKFEPVKYKRAFIL